MMRMTLSFALCLAATLVLACRDAKAPAPAAPAAPATSAAPSTPTAPAPASPAAEALAELKYQRFVFSPDPVYQELLIGAPQTGGMRSGRVVLLPGKAMERHSTKGNEEMLVFLKGEVRVVLGTETLVMAEGQALYIPPQTEHELHNDGTGEARYVYIVAPAGRAAP